MGTPLRVLIVEDSEEDAMLILRELRNGRHEVESERVYSGETMRQALDRREWDIILADWRMPGFSGIEALRIVQERERPIPFIIISGTIGEDLAVTALTAGASDFLLKDRLGRLLPAVERAILENANKLEHLRLEEALRISKSYLDVIINAAGDPIFVKDCESKFILVNDALCVMLGIDRKNIIGKTLAESLPRDQMDHFLEVDRKVLVSGKEDICEELLTGRGGIILNIETKKTRYVDERGGRFLVGVIHDITERKRSEKRIEIQLAITTVLAKDGSFDEAAPRILESLCVALDWHWAVIWHVDEACKGLRFQAAWAPKGIDMGPYLREVGKVVYGPGEGLPGRAWESKRIIWIPDSSLNRNQARMASILNGVLEAGIRMSVAIPIICERAVVAVMILGRREPGEPDDRLIKSFTVLGDHIGQYLERKRGEEVLEDSEAKLRQAQKMEAIGRLAGGVAHDFNNILTVISGYSELMLANMSSADVNRKKIEVIKQSSDHAAALTHQLLAFSRKQALEPKVIDMKEMLVNLEPMLGRLIGEDVVLNVVPGPEPCGVFTDINQMTQVIINLSVNAHDAMSGGGKLTIGVCNEMLDEKFIRAHGISEPGMHVRISVTDNGSGMSEEAKAHLFEPFFTTKGEGKGTGLGLSMVYGIVHQSGGGIVVGDAPGGGTTIDIYLPRKEGTADEKPAGHSGNRKKHGKETILVVDDQDEVREVTAEILKMGGYTILAAEGGEAAVKKAREYEGVIDLLVSDMVMPEMDGRVVASRLRAGRPALKALYMSGYTENVSLKADALEKWESYIGKPFGVKEMTDKVREVLDGAVASPVVVS